MGARDSMETDDGVAELNAADIGRCDNCGHVGEVKPLIEVNHLWDRVAPGEPVPLGECLKCGAMSHLLTTESERSAEPVAALLKIAAARDYCAEHGRFPAHPHGPGPDQCFDDWAADLACNALSHEEVPYPGPDLELPPGPHGWVEDRSPPSLRMMARVLERAAELLLDYHVKTGLEEYTDTGVAWEVMAEVYGKLTRGRDLDADSLAVREGPDKLIRADVCLTLKVPAGTRIDESGGIILPDGSELIPATRKGMVEHVEHIYHTTPVEVAELYEGNDH